MIRHYMWTSQHDEGVQNWGTLSGTDLKHAIALSLERNGWATLYSTSDFHPANNCGGDDDECSSPDTGCDGCDKAEYLTFDQMAEKIMDSIQYSYVDGDSSEQITVWDITNPDNPIMLLPCNESMSGAFVNHPKYKYEYVTIVGIHGGIKEAEYELKLQHDGTWAGDLRTYHVGRENKRDGRMKSEQLVTVNQWGMREFILGKNNNHYMWAVYKRMQRTDRERWQVCDVEELYEVVTE